MREGKAKVLSREQFKQVLKSVKSGSHGKRNSALLYVSFFLGLRVSEIASLNISSITNKKGELLSEAILKGKDTKTKQSRTLYLEHTELVVALKDYLKERQEKDGNLYNREAPLFRSQKDNRFSPNALQQVFSRFYDGAGLSGCKSHTGRRSFATWMLDDGIHIKNVQVFMGHKSIVTTAQYMEANPNTLRRIAARL